MQLFCPSWSLIKGLRGHLLRDRIGRRKEERYVHAALLDGSRSRVARLIISVDGSVTGVDTTVMVIRSS
ncbi:MAG: hypothetical protein AUF76_13025 [Acidobacteria bacterium 13_1_20CM_2_65_9]|nr:MAG: hypothetical protein AUF76_13025 [Acidobacteria bacterium 13_1_20CM_2_65_9]